MLLASKEQKLNFASSDFANIPLQRDTIEVGAPSFVSDFKIDNYNKYNALLRANPDIVNLAMKLEYELQNTEYYYNSERIAKDKITVKKVSRDPAMNIRLGNMVSLMENSQFVRIVGNVDEINKLLSASPKSVEIGLLAYIRKDKLQYSVGVSYSLQGVIN